jgi:hypothetical protein
MIACTFPLSMAGIRPSLTAICCVDDGVTPFFLRMVLRTAVEVSSPSVPIF